MSNAKTDSKSPARDLARELRACAEAARNVFLHDEANVDQVLRDDEKAMDRAAALLEAQAECVDELRIQAERWSDDDELNHARYVLSKLSSLDSAS